MALAVARAAPVSELIELFERAPPDGAHSLDG
jgi:hypothetical protein